MKKVENKYMKRISVNINLKHYAQLFGKNELF